MPQCHYHKNIALARFECFLPKKKDQHYNARSSENSSLYLAFFRASGDYSY